MHWNGQSRIGAGGTATSVLNLTILTALSLVFATSSLGQQASQSIDPAAIDTAVTSQMEKQQLVGLSVAVVRGDRLAYAKGFGYADREKNIKASSETMYRWASVSKPVTAIAAMQLVESGKLYLDDDVRKYVPEFPDHGHVIRVRDLLCHQSGIVHYTNGPVVKTDRDYDSEHPYESVILALDTFKESPLVHPPGQKYSYSTHAYILLSAVVERAGKQKFTEQVHQRICQPLGIKSLQPDYQWIEIADRAVGYRKQFGRRIVPSGNTDVSWKLGGGGFISNVEDMAAFARGIMNDDLVSAKTRRLMWEPQTLKNGDATNVGLGLFVGRQGKQISHNGAQEKTRTRMVIFPEQKIAIVAMTNSEYGKCGEITTAIANALNR